MLKVVTNSYVFKFVGGEAGQRRQCHYCQVMKSGGMLVVYPNCGCDRADTTIYVCPGCVRRGCKESEVQWKTLTKSSPKNKRKSP